MNDIPQPPSFGGSFNDSPANPYVAPESTPAPKRRRKGIAVALAGILAVGGVGMAGYQFLAGDGASSPEAALERLTDAISNEDLAGAIDALAPEERAAFADPVRRMNSEMKRIGVLGSSMDLSSIPGVDLEITDVRTERTQIHEQLAVLEVTGGTLRASGNLDEVPLGSRIREAMDEFMDEDDARSGETEEDLAEADLRIATVRRDGGWYVSLWYSVAEAARSDSGKEAPRPEDAIPARGADSPEDAVRDLVNAAVNADPRRAIELIDPVEGRVLHEYGPLLLDEWESPEDTPDIRIDRLDLRTERDGNRARVSPERFTATWGTEERPGSLTFDGECLVLSETRRSGKVNEERFCANEEPNDDEEWNLFASLFSPLASASMASLEAVAITTVEVDGSWYISPIGTVTEMMLRGLAAVDDNGIDSLVDGMESFFEDFDSDFDEDYFDEDYEDPFGPCSDLIEQIYMEETPSAEAIDEAAACTAPLVESGELDPMMVPDVVLAPTCAPAISDAEAVVDEGVFMEEDTPIEELLSAAEAAWACIAEHHADMTDSLAVPTTECLLLWEEEGRDSEAYYECVMDF